MGAEPKKHPSMSRWLGKISFVTAEFRKLVKILTTPALSSLFGESIPIRWLDNTPRVSRMSQDLQQKTSRRPSQHLVTLRITLLNLSRTSSLNSEIEAASKTRTPTIHNFSETHLLIRVL